MEITLATLKKLTKFDTPTICNVIELFDIRPESWVHGWPSKVQFPELPPIVGYACTASFRSRCTAGRGRCVRIIQTAGTVS